MSDLHTDRSMPVRPEPFWLDSVTIPSFPALQNDDAYDVVIVGGGITGITTAYLLSQESLRVALIEANQILRGTTAHTTAKITAQHDLFYDELLHHVGRTKARLYYEANASALSWMKKCITEQAIACDFTVEDAIAYATTDATARAIEKEYEAYQKLHIPGELLDSIPFSFSVTRAIMMREQAQFHPLAYLTHLVQEAVANGVHFYENTVADDIEYSAHPVVVTRNGQRITADKVLLCSHFPFYDGLGFYFARMQAQRSYLLAVKSEIPYPGGMYISADQPVRSLRSVLIKGESMVLVGGETHITGQGRDTEEHYRALATFASEALGAKEILYRWATQDLTTLDKIPYIGEITSGKPHVMVATGYKKWGMTTGTAAAHLLRDLTLGRNNPYADVFSPQRFFVDPSLKQFLAQSVNVGAHLVKGKLELPSRAPEDIRQGEGAVVTCQGQRAGAYRTSEGELFVLDTTCTHMGCEVMWNHGDRTWDCPCHGSRFSYEGAVVEGPATKPLTRLQ